MRRRLEAVWQTSDGDFAADLTDRELGLMADGVRPGQIFLYLAVVRTARGVRADQEAPRDTAHAFSANRSQRSGE